MDTTSRHLLVELHDCDRSRLDDLELIQERLEAAAARAGARVVNRVFHRFAPHGVTGVVVVEESHLSVHTWPEAGYAAVDFFTCGACRPELAVGLIADALGARRRVFLEVRRGLPLPAGCEVLAPEDR